METIKYIVEIQMIYSFDKRSMIVTVGEFDNFDDALDTLENEAYLYSNYKNVAIELSRYEFNIETQKYEYLETLIGFYGIDAAKYLYIFSKKKKYGLIIV